MKILSDQSEGRWLGVGVLGVLVGGLWLLSKAPKPVVVSGDAPSPIESPKATTVKPAEGEPVLDAAFRPLSDWQHG